MTRLAAVLVLLAWLQASPSSAAPTADDLFDSGVLHDVWIHLNARDWAALRANYQENTFYPCDFEWRDVKAYNAGCRSRGTGSRSGSKPALYVQFGHYVAGQRFLGLSAVVLDNFWQDASMLREPLSMRLFRRMGVAAPRAVHVRLFVGSAHDFAGVYGLTEDIDAAFLERQFGDAAGYLYEYRWRDEYRFEDLGSDFEPYAARFEPRSRQTDSSFALYAPLRDMVRAIGQAEPSNLASDVAAHLDLRTFVLQLAIENFVAEWDGLAGYAGLNNFYLYRPSSGVPPVVIAWDKDLAFTWLDMPPWHNLDTNVLTGKIWHSPEYRTMYIEALAEAAELAGWLEEEALRQYALIRQAVLEDPVKPVTNAGFEEAVDEVRRFARERGGIVRRFITGLSRAGAWSSVTGSGAGVARP